MSNAVLDSLPRFDTGDRPAAAGQLKRLLGQAPEEVVESEPPVQEEMAEAEAPEPQVPEPQAPSGPDLQEVERLAAGLSEAVARVERDAREQAMHVIQALAARLFPELSRHFLAEEIGRHLPKLVPPSVPAVEIRATPAMLEQLEPIIARNAALAGRCSLVPVETAEQGNVQVSWTTGGVTFDFDGLLAACLAHLDPAQTLIEE